MPPQPAPTPTRRAVTQLDHRLEAVTGHDIDTLWTYRDRGALDEPHTQLVDRHRTLANAQIGVTFYLKLLNRLTSGEFPVDGALFVRIDRTVDQLEEAANARDAAAQEVLAALEPIEAAAAASTPDEGRLSTDDRAALLAIARRCQAPRTPADRPTVRDRLLRHPHPLSPDAAAGTRQASPSGTPATLCTPSQPVSLTDAGRAALLDARRTPATHAPTSPARPGAPPSTPAKRR
ncbi:hypothetical protein R2F25_09565 [Streptomyces sp. UP1A-1]|nr:hypothetical protein [Streptomyces sp. UP1A-1]